MGMGKIVDLARHRKPRDASERETVEQHWMEIGGATDIPARDGIDPAALGDALGSILIVERIAPRQTRIRLGGQRISSVLGMDLRGMPLSALFDPESRDWLGDLTETLFDTPARLEIGLAGPRTTFRPRVFGDVLFLPLRDREGQITRAIGHIVLPGRMPTAPVRLSITGETKRGLCARSRPPVADTADFGAADAAREILRRRGALRLVPTE